MANFHESTFWKEKGNSVEWQIFDRRISNVARVTEEALNFTIQYGSRIRGDYVTILFAL